MMSNEMLHMKTRSQIYDIPLEKKSECVSIDKTSPSTPPPTNGLQIEKRVFDTVLRPPKNTIQKLVFNPSTHVAQYYNIVEDLAQAP